VLAPGTVAPPFELPDEHGNLVRLSDLRGKWVLIWWYPKAQTPARSKVRACAISPPSSRPRGA